MDLTNVKTVQDLINLNIETEMEHQSVSDLMDAIMKLTPSEGKEIALEVLKALNEMHKVAVEQYIQDGDADKASMWARDQAFIATAYNVLKQVELWVFRINNFTSSLAMNYSPSSMPSVSDMEDFAKEYLGLQGSDTDLFYESYYNLDNDGYEEDEYRDETNQTKWEYWYLEGLIPSIFVFTWQDELFLLNL